MGVISHSYVSSHDGHELRRLVQQFGGCKVDRIECADWFDGKRATDSSEYSTVNVHSEAASLERPESSNGSLFLRSCQSAGCARPYDCTRGLGEGEGGRHVPSSHRQRFDCGRVVLQQGRYECARLHVSNAGDRC